MTNLAKKDVREHFVKKFEQKEKEIQNKVYKAVSEACEPHINKWVGNVSLIENKADALAEDLRQLTERHKPIIGGWKYQEIISGLNSRVINIGKTIKDSIVRDIFGYILNPHHQAYDSYIEESKAVAEKLVEDTKSLRKILSDTVKLKNEILTIIDSSNNGNKAFNTLKELGVDLSGINKTSSALPAVIKLSVDVSLINGSGTQQ
ncbi:hypothetical protein [Paenibacillus chitinolyticus]|uniref:hypothetical protein n=1 Tax=Paenibacillus chitinolyticus TaxID=79263 RepID=UPI003D038F39